MADNHYNNNTLHAVFRIERNDKKIYWQNKFHLEKKWNSDLGLLQNESIQTRSAQMLDIKQRYRTNYMNLSNSFNTVIPLKKQLMQFKSTVNYYHLPQNLTVFPGQFDSLVNEGLSYAAVKQELDIHVFNTTNEVSWTKAFGDVSFSPLLGFETDQQTLTSELANPFVETDKMQPGLHNNAHFSKWGGFGSINGQLKKDNWRLDFRLPVKYQTIKVADRLTSDKNILNKMTFDPGVEAMIDLNQSSSFTLNTNVNHHFGNLSGLYTGFVLHSYRHVQRMTNDIPVSKVWQNALRWNFKDPLHQLFLEVAYNLMSVKNNLIYSADIGTNGSIQTVVMLKDNTTTRGTVSLSADKYILPIKSSIKATAGYSYSSNEILLNKIFTDVHNKSLDFGIQLDVLVAKPLNIAYTGSYTMLRSQVVKGGISSLTQQVHHLNFSIFPSENHMISIKGDYYANDFSDHKSQFFMDVSYRYSFGKKKKYDLSIIFNNILDAHQFQSFQNRDYLTVEHTFKIRRRQALLQLGFNF